jgi:hypothetical protein
MSSVALRAEMCTPRISPYFASETIFHKAVVAADDGGFRVAGEGELAHFDLVALFFRLSFGEADEPICGSQ